MKPRDGVCIVMSLFFAASLRLVNADFYYDELLTLKKAVFVPLWDVISQYTSLNTHVLHAAICNVIMKPFDMDMILDAPYLIRLPQLIFPMISIWLIYLLGKEIHSERAGLVAATILATTLPFYYYAASIRGYELSLTLYLAVLLSAYRENYLSLGVFAVLCIWVMPSNAVFVLAVFALGDDNTFSTGLIVILVSAILYWHLILGISGDPQTMAHGSSIRNLTESIPEAMNAFVSYRWLLLPVAVYGYYRKFHIFLLEGLFITFVSCMVFIILGSYMWARVLFPLFGIWAMFIAIGISNVWSK